MKQKRKGLRLQCTTFRVVPDEILELQRTGVIKATTLTLWLQMQRFAVLHNRPVRFRELAEYAGVSRSTLADALKEMLEHGLILKIEDGQYPVYAIDFSPESGSKIEPRGSKIDPRGSKIEPRGSKIEPRGSKIEPPQAQNSPRDIKRRIETLETSPCVKLHAPPSRDDSWQAVGSVLSHINLNSESHTPDLTAEIHAFRETYGFEPPTDALSLTKMRYCLQRDADEKVRARYLKDLRKRAQEVERAS